MSKGFRLTGFSGQVGVAIISCGVLMFASTAASYYDSLYASKLGASPIIIGVINSTGLLSAAISGILLGWVAEQYGIKRAVLFMLGLFLIHQTIYTLAWSWWVLIAAVAVSSRMIRIGPFADIIIVTSTSPERRAFIVSLSRLIWNSLSVIAPMMAAVLVTSSGGITVEGIRPLYGMQLILCLLTFLYLTYSLPPTVGRIGLQGSYKQKLSSIFGEYLDAFKGEKYLKRWILLENRSNFRPRPGSPFLLALAGGG